MAKYTAVIPVRENKGMFNSPKDILPFGKSNLLLNKISQLKGIKNVEVIVSTDSDMLREMAVSAGASVIMRKRLPPWEYAFPELVFEVCEELQTEHIIWSCVTSPMIETPLYRKAITIYEDKLSMGYDSLISVKRIQRYLLDNNGSLNYRTGSKFTEKGELPELFVFTNGISIAPRAKMMEWKHTSGEIPYKMELNKCEAIDICDNFDYECARHFWSMKNYEG